MYNRAAEDEDEEKKEGFIDKMKTGVKEAPTKIKDEINKDAKFLSEKTHIPTWGIFTIFAVIVLVVIGVIGWCIYRFMKKKKPKGAEDKKGEEDDNALVDNEEANIEDIEEPEQQEGHGRLKYRLEYDFTTQELKVTVLEAQEL